MIDITTIYAKRMMDRSNYIESLKLITNYYKNCKQKCNHNDYIDMGGIIKYIKENIILQIGKMQNLELLNVVNVILVLC